MEYGPSLGGTPYVGQPIGLPVNFGMRFSMEEPERKDSAVPAEDETEVKKKQDERTAEG